MPDMSWNITNERIKQLNGKQVTNK